MSVIAGIPARMGSSRFPGKPLARLLGLAMIEHVYKRTALCQELDSVFVATCDQEIANAVKSFGGNVVMTSDKHQRASDRIAEAARKMDADIIVMVQGDEPMVVPEMVSLAIQPMLIDPGIECVNLTKRIEDEAEYRDPNTIKVLMDRNGDALYMSREPVPTSHIQHFGDIPVYKQVCIIPFRRQTLLGYAELDPTPLEQAESIDMLRLLEHRRRVHMVETRLSSHAVDTPEDLKRVEAIMREDSLLPSYMDVPS